MERIILELSNPGDLQLLKLLAERIGIKIIEENNKSTVVKETRNFDFTDKGCDISNFGDPLKWQKEERNEKI